MLLRCSIPQARGTFAFAHRLGTGQFNLAQARRRERAVQGRKDEEGERRRREFHACKREIAARRARLNCYHVPVSGTLAHQFSSYANPFGVLESSNEDDEDEDEEDENDEDV